MQHQTHQSTGAIHRESTTYLLAWRTTRLNSSHPWTQLHLLMFPAPAATRAGRPAGAHVRIAHPVSVHIALPVHVPLRVSQMQPWKREYSRWSSKISAV